MCSELIKILILSGLITAAIVILINVINNYLKRKLGE